MAFLGLSGSALGRAIQLSRNSTTSPGPTIALDAEI